MAKLGQIVCNYTVNGYAFKLYKIGQTVMVC